MRALILILAVELFGSEVDFSRTDFMPRLVNFLIFVILMYILLKKPIGGIFKERRENIKNQFESIQEELLKLQEEKEKMIKKQEETKQFIEELYSVTKEEIKKIESHFHMKIKREIELIFKNLENDKKIIEQDAKKEIIEKVLDELFLLDEIRLNTSDIINLLKKVG